jgi:hypothetical protein
MNGTWPEPYRGIRESGIAEVIGYRDSLIVDFEGARHGSLQRAFALAR